MMKRAPYLLSIILFICISCASQPTVDLEQDATSYVVENLKNLRVVDYEDGLSIYVNNELTMRRKDQLINEGMSKMLGLFEFTWPTDTLSMAEAMNYSENERRSSNEPLSDLPPPPNAQPESTIVLSANNRVLFKGAYYVVINAQVSPSHHTCDVYLKYSMEGEFQGKKLSCHIE